MPAKLINTESECKRGHRGRMRLNKQGYHVCRACHQESNARYRQQDRDREAQAKRTLYGCTNAIHESSGDRADGEC